VQPDNAKPDLTPGRCRGKVHQRATLGYTGRRVLVSRNWSGKTLIDHRLDGRDWFRAVTAGLLDDQADTVTNDPPAEKGRYRYMVARRRDRDVDGLAERILRSIAARERARAALRAAHAATEPPDVATSASNPGGDLRWR
jgi:hypothetical protein